MKTLTISALLLLSATLSAQSNCDNISKENQQLKTRLAFLEEKLKFSEAFNNDSISTIKSFNSDFEFKLMSCVGNTGSQTVKVEILVTLKSTNQKLSALSYGTKAIDNLGNEVVSKYALIGGQMSRTDLYTNIPVLITAEFPSVMPGTDKFEILTMSLSRQKPNERETKFETTEIRNIPIIWE